MQLSKNFQKNKMEIIKITQYKLYIKQKPESNFQEKILENDKKEKILWIGEVQSGKTKHIINFIKKSINYGYKITLYLGGINKILTKQSEKRVREELKNEKEIDIIGEKQYDWFFRNWQQYFQEKRHFVIVIMKTKKMLESVLNNFFKLAFLGQTKILLVDDECDYASDDIGKQGKHSSIFLAINEIWKHIEKGKMISVTATPFSSINNQRKTGSAYDRSYLLKANDEYTGIEKFAKTKQLNYFSLLSTKKDWQSSIWPSLLCWLACSAVGLIENKEFKSEFLINIDLKTPTHDEIRKFIFKHMQDIQSYISTKDQYSFPFNPDKPPYIAKISNVPYTELIAKIKEILKNFIKNKGKNIFLLNSQANCDFISGNYQFAIIIGGSLISRGFTFEYLTTELILNSPHEKDSLDTLLQRARWFGYRQDRKKYIRIIMNEKLLKSYNEALEVIKIVKENGNDIKVLEQKLNVIAKSLEHIKLTGKN